MVLGFKWLAFPDSDFPLPSFNAFSLFLIMLCFLLVDQSFVID